MTTKEPKKLSVKELLIAISLILAGITILTLALICYKTLLLNNTLVENVSCLQMLENLFNGTYTNLIAILPSVLYLITIITSALYLLLGLAKFLGSKIPQLVLTILCYILIVSAISAFICANIYAYILKTIQTYSVVSIGLYVTLVSSIALTLLNAIAHKK